MNFSSPLPLVHVAERGKLSKNGNLRYDKKGDQTRTKEKSKTGLIGRIGVTLRWIGIGVRPFYRGLHRFPLCPHSNNPYILAANPDLGLHSEWMPIEEISDTLKLTVVAADDVNFCQHWGFDAVRHSRRDSGWRGSRGVDPDTTGREKYLSLAWAQLGAQNA